MNLVQADKMDLHVLSRVMPVSHVSREGEPIAPPSRNTVLHMWRAEHWRFVVVVEWGMNHESGARWTVGSACTVARAACEPCVKRDGAQRAPQMQMHIAHVVRCEHLCCVLWCADLLMCIYRPQRKGGWSRSPALSQPWRTWSPEARLLLVQNG